MLAQKWRGKQNIKKALEVQSGNTIPMADVQEFVTFLSSNDSEGITGRILYNQWDDWRNLKKESLQSSSLYTLRRIDGRSYNENNLIIKSSFCQLTERSGTVGGELTNWGDLI